MELHVVFEPDEADWVRVTIEELPGVITCARASTRDASALRGGLDAWLQALTSPERPVIGPDATRETLNLTIA